jgi:hypothetical protein
MSTKMIASQAQPPSTSTRTPPRVTTVDAFIGLTKSDTVFATFSAPKAKKKRTQK